MVKYARGPDQSVSKLTFIQGAAVGPRLVMPNLLHSDSPPMVSVAVWTEFGTFSGLEPVDMVGLTSC